MPRPRLPASKQLRRMLGVRFRDRDLVAIQAAARRSSVAPVSFVREAAIAAAARVPAEGPTAADVALARVELRREVHRIGVNLNQALVAVQRHRDSSGLLVPITSRPQFEPTPVVRALLTTIQETQAVVLDVLEELTDR